MARQLAAALREAIETAIPKFEAITEEAAAAVRVGWTRKQELGHLLDSAANNHQRFVRGGLDGHYQGPGYPGDPWVEIHGYADLPWAFLVRMWHDQNFLLARVIENIPEASLSGECIIGDNQPETLAFVIEDYVVHLTHHVERIAS